MNAPSHPVPVVARCVTVAAPIAASVPDPA